jgi:hypothetical protein
MKSIGKQEFEDKPSDYLGSQEIIAIQQNEKLIGLYIPIKDNNQASIQQAFQKLSKTVANALAESQLSEDALSQALNLSNNHNA